MTIINDDRPIIGVIWQCPKCEQEYARSYEPSISYDVFSKQRYQGSFTCQKCSVRCEPDAQLRPKQEEAEYEELIRKEEAKYGKIALKTTKGSVKAKPIVEHAPAPLKMESMEKWSTLLDEKRNLLRKAVKDNLPQIWLAIELVLSVKSILNIKDCTLPLFIILLGAASSLKTVAIQLLRSSRYAFYTDGFSPKAFVSHSTAVNRQELEKIDMLPKIKNKIACTRNVSPIHKERRRTNRNSWCIDQSIRW